jgi:hypothetical protein
VSELPKIAASRHPLFQQAMPDFDLWRLTYFADDFFIRRYLEKFSNREDDQEFIQRMKVTPVPAFAASAINDIKNAIFQRLTDVSRVGGSDAYQSAVSGEGLGVDRRGRTMNGFIGSELLVELLVMGQVGVYVDNSVFDTETLAARPGTPYIYSYKREDILNWKQSSPDRPSDFQSVLLRDTIMEHDSTTGMPMKTVERFRLIWISEETGRVNVRFIDKDDNDIEPPRELDLDRIPFVLIDIGDSLIRTVARHQIALLNLASSDVWYALKSNFPFYTEQQDSRARGGHLKPAASDGTGAATTDSRDMDVKVGVTQGRIYGPGMDRPRFISPPSGPLEASIRLQEKLERDIRRLVNLAVATLGQKSAESKEMDNQGLEAGLSFIGLVLENAERKIASHWAAYEERIENRRRVASVKYPDRYSLKTDKDRIDESESLGKLIYKIPGRTAKREIAKQIVHALLGGKVNVDTIRSIESEIDTSPYLTSDPKVIIDAVEAGLAGERTGSIALGFSDDEYQQAREDHAIRIARIQEAQTSPSPRGNPDEDDDPARNAAAEKEASRQTDMRDSTASRTRGEGRQ